MGKRKEEIISKAKTVIWEYRNLHYGNNSEMGKDSRNENEKKYTSDMTQEMTSSKKKKKKKTAIFMFSLSHSSSYDFIRLIWYIL